MAKNGLNSGRSGLTSVRRLSEEGNGNTIPVFLFENLMDTESVGYSPVNGGLFWDVD